MVASQIESVIIKLGFERVFFVDRVRLSGWSAFFFFFLKEGVDAVIQSYNRFDLDARVEKDKGLDWRFL